MGTAKLQSMNPVGIRKVVKQHSKIFDVSTLTSELVTGSVTIVGGSNVIFELGSVHCVGVPPWTRPSSKMTYDPQKIVTDVGVPHWTHPSSKMTYYLQKL